DLDGAARADQYHQPPGARHGRVEQIALQHHVMLHNHGYHHTRVLRTLRLVDANGKGMDQFVRFQETVDHRYAVDGDRDGLLDHVNSHDAADIAIIYAFVIVIHRLHHFVADAEGAAGNAPLHLAAGRV